jgi:hypothetical protein
MGLLRNNNRPEKGTYPLIRVLKEYGQPMKYTLNLPRYSIGFLPFILYCITQI